VRRQRLLGISTGVSGSSDPAKWHTLNARVAGLDPLRHDCTHGLAGVGVDEIVCQEQTVEKHPLAAYALRLVLEPVN